jgi:hypothetical protein
MEKKIKEWSHDGRDIDDKKKIDSNKLLSSGEVNSYLQVKERQVV